MTLEDLLGFNADQLEAMSDEQLLEYFKDALNVTRPELAPKPNRSAQNTFNFAEQEAIKKLKEMGIDASHLKPKHLHR